LGKRDLMILTTYLPANLAINRAVKQISVSANAGLLVTTDKL